LQKYGFVYIWRDRKHSRYYIGCHWGTEDDGYICSSPWMKRAYKLRSQDFIRKILARIYTNKKDLLNEEYRYLKMIKKEELRKKYYNMHNYNLNNWYIYEDKSLIVINKIKIKTKEAMIRPEVREKYLNGIKLREQDKKYNDFSSHVRCYKQSLARKGRPHSEEHKAALRKPKSPRSEEHTINLSNAIKGLTYKIKKTKCIKCGFKSNISHITRYHNENCKLYEINWKDIKNDYFIENYSFRALERKYNVNRMLIANKLRNGK
jgi:hypothetical protein